MPLVYPNGQKATNVTKPHLSASPTFNDSDPVYARLDCGCPKAKPKWALAPVETVRRWLIEDVSKKDAFADGTITGLIGHPGKRKATSEPAVEFRITDLDKFAAEARRRKLIPFSPWAPNKDALKATDRYTDWLASL